MNRAHPVAVLAAVPLLVPSLGVGQTAGQSSAFQDFYVVAEEPVVVPAGDTTAERDEDPVSPIGILLMTSLARGIGSAAGSAWTPVARGRAGSPEGSTRGGPPVICRPEEQEEEKPTTAITTEMERTRISCGTAADSKEGEEADSPVQLSLAQFFYAILPLPWPGHAGIDLSIAEMPPLEEPPTTAIMTEMGQTLVWPDGLTTEDVGRLSAGGHGLNPFGGARRPGGPPAEAGGSAGAPGEAPSDVAVEDPLGGLEEDLPESSTLPEPEGPTGEEAARALHPVLPGDHRHNRPPPEGASAIPQFPVWTYNRSLDRYLEDEADRVYGQPPSREKGEGADAVPLVVKQGLILLRDTRVAQLRGFVPFLRGILESSDADKAARARALIPAATRVQQAHRAMRDAWDAADEPPAGYIGPMNPSVDRGRWSSVRRERTERLLAEADSLAAAGDEEGARARKEAAAESPWGQYMQRRSEFVTLLRQHPLLGLRTGDSFYWDGTTLWDALLDLELREVPVDARQRLLVQTLDRYLEAGIEGAEERAAEFDGQYDLARLFPLAGPRYAAHHRAAILQGAVAGSTLPARFVDAAKGHWNGFAVSKEEEEAFEQALWDLSLGVLAAVTMPIPIVGVVVNAGVSGFYIYQSGRDVYVAYQQEREAEQTAGVTGYEGVLRAEERSSEAVRGFLLTTAVGALDLYGVRQLGRLRGARGAAAAAEDAGELGLRELAPDEVEFWRQKYASRGGLDRVDHWLATAERQLGQLDDLVRLAQRHGLTAEEIRDLLRAHRSADGILDVIEALGPEIVVQSALKRGVTVVVHPSELGEFLRYARSARSAPVRRVDLMTLYWVRAKAVFEAAGVSMPWTAAERRFVRDQLLPRWDELGTWAEFNASEGGFLRLFDDHSLRAVRDKAAREGLSYGAGGGAGAAAPRGARAGREGAPQGPAAAPPRTEAYGRGQVVNPREGETLIDAGRAGRGGTEAWAGSPRSALAPPEGLDDRVLFHARQEAAGNPQSWTPAELQRLHELRAAPGGFRSAFGQRLTARDVAALENATTAATPTRLFRIELPRASELGPLPPAADPPGFPRTGPGDTQVIPLLQPDWAPPRLGPGDTQVLPRAGPGETRFLPRRTVDSEIVGRAAEPLFFRFPHPEGAGAPRPGGAEGAPARLTLPQDAGEIGGPSGGAGRGAPELPGGSARAAGALPVALLNAPPGAPPSCRACGTVTRPSLMAATDRAVPSDAPAVELFVTSLGGSTGEVMEMRVLNNGARTVELDVSGTVLRHVPLAEEERAALQARLAEPADAEHFVTTRLTAYCLEYLKKAPGPGHLFRVAPPAVQESYARLGRVVSVARRVADEGLLHPDSDPAGYLRSITQWAVWSRERGFDAEEFGEAFLRHSRRAAEAAGYEWSEAVERQARGLVPNRWRDIRAVVDAAERAAAPEGDRQ